MARQRSSRGAGEGPSSPALRPIEEEALREAVASLAALDLAGLRLQWRNVFGGSAPVHLPKPLLARILAYRLQADAFGDLPTPSAGRSRASALGARPLADKRVDRAGHGRLCDGSNPAPSWFANGMAVSTASWRWRKASPGRADPTAACPRSRGRSPAVTGTGRGSSASPDPGRWRARQRRSRSLNRRGCRASTKTQGSPHESTTELTVGLRPSVPSMRGLYARLDRPRARTGLQFPRRPARSLRGLRQEPGS